jgi:DNA-binding beta-propeller fold protein YncE
MNDDRPLAGPQLAGYRVGELLGRGSMGDVYRADDVRLGRSVALKVLVPGLGTEESLLRESRLAAGLDHPNVVPVFEAGDDGGRLFIAMRYVAGGDLRALLRREGKLATARCIAIAAQVADALDAAHRRGLVHRDVKPSNVLLDHADGREHCYLADFGLTQRAAEANPAAGHLVGTVAYVAPEQIRGDPIDGRADQYALAALLFECLTGTAPFEGRSDVAVIFAHLEEPVPPASGRDPSLPAAIDAVLARGMAKDPGERFASCTELVRAAGTALGVDGTAGRPRRLRRLLPAALAVLALGVAAIALLGDGTTAPPVVTGAIVRIDPAANRVSSSTPVDGHPGELAVTPGGIWMADFRDGVLWRYEPGSGRVERMTSTGEPRDLAALGRKVYVGADGRFLNGIVSRYDAVSGVREDGIELLACAMASGEGVLWAAGCPSVQRLSTGDGRLRELGIDVFLPFQQPERVETARAQLRELAVGAGSVWVLGDALDRRMWRLDARTGAQQAVLDLGFAPTSLVVAAGRVWITDGVGDRVVPIDIERGVALPAVPVGRGPSGIAAGAGGVWVANTLDRTVSRLDPEQRRVVATIEMGSAPRGVAVGPGAVWVTEHAS